MIGYLKGENKMIKVDLRDPNLIINVKSILSLKESGFFSQEESQALYDEQVKKDSENTLKLHLLL